MRGHPGFTAFPRCEIIKSNFNIGCYMKISITRPGIPSTQLNIKIISRNPHKLGGGRPVAFILPGGPGAELAAYQKYECLSEVVDLVLHDPRGCGESDLGDPATYTMNNYIDDVEAIRQYLKIDHIIVIGKSYGAMCALGYVLRYPNVVNKLVLAAGAPSYHFFEIAKRNIEQRGTPDQIAIYEKLSMGDIQNRDELLTYFRQTNPLYSVKARSCPDEFDLEKKSRRFSYEVLNEGFRHQYWRFDYEHELKNITCPTLVLVGEEDWITDPHYSILMAEQIPNSSLVIFKHASHAMEADVPEEYFQTIADFIA